jgi:hypothetical protein
MISWMCATFRVPGGTCLCPLCPGSPPDDLTFGRGLLYRSTMEAYKHKPLITLFPKQKEVQIQYTDCLSSVAFKFVQRNKIIK